MNEYDIIADEAAEGGFEDVENLLRRGLEHQRSVRIRVEGFEMELVPISIRIDLNDRMPKLKVEFQVVANNPSIVVDWPNEWKDQKPSYALSEAAGALIRGWMEQIRTFNENPPLIEPGTPVYIDADGRARAYEERRRSRLWVPEQDPPPLIDEHGVATVRPSAPPPPKVRQNPTDPNVIQ